MKIDYRVGCIVVLVLMMNTKLYSFLDIMVIITIIIIFIIIIIIIIIIIAM